MKIIGAHKVEGLLHGSPIRFEAFDQSKLSSLGFHFGDLDQARHFARSRGFTYRANLTFRSLVDIGGQDWGWTSAKHIAFAFYIACVFGRIPLSREDFFPIMGPMPWPGSIELKKTNELSEEEQIKLIDLFRSYNCDGVRYINKFEPPGRAGGVAYFIFDPSQIELLEVKPA